MRNDRLNEMEKYVLRHESVTMEALCAQFGVSMNTVRRDISMLLKKGTIEKVYGGVCMRVNGESQLTPYELRTGKNADAKRVIGMEAASLVEDNDIIFLDSGTTTLEIVPYLAQKGNITIITNNLEAIVSAVPYDNLNVMCLPGQLQRKTNSFTGLDAIRQFKGYNIKTAFMAATGLSVNGVTNSSPLEYEIKMMAMSRSEKRVLVIDSQKFGKTALLTYATVDQFDAVVTDSAPDRKYIEALKAANTDLIIAGNRRAAK